MRIFILVFITFYSSTLWSIDTVENLKIKPYMGLWYEIASIPQSFSKDCLGNTTAEYKLLDNDQIQVLNSCDQQNGRKTAEGRARINKKYNSNSKLEVTFAKIFNNWIWTFSGDYWVLEISPNYNWSVVGHPSLDYLWILSRKQTMKRNQLLKIRRYLEDVGYNSCDILLTPNEKNHFNGQERLCDL